MKTEKPIESKREAILDAAAEIFKGRRFDEVKLDDISTAAGVGKGTLYLYFKNKEDLFAQMAVAGLNGMAARIREIAAMKTPYKDRLFLFGNEFAAFLARRHGVMRVMAQMQTGSVEKVFRRHLSQMIDAMHDFFQAGIDTGALRDDFTPAEFRCVLVGPIMLKVRRQESVGEKIDLDALLRFFWTGAAKV